MGNEAPSNCAAMVGSLSTGRYYATDAAPIAGRTNLFSQLDAKGIKLRERVLQIQREYEMGRVTLEEEFALFRGIEREFAVIDERMFDLAAERHSVTRTPPTKNP